MTTRKFSCKFCGYEYDANPPDDLHTIALLSPCEKGDSIEIPYDCKDCYERNKLYWDGGHTFIAVVRSGSERTPKSMVSHD